jgi:hypothetical protein
MPEGAVREHNKPSRTAGLWAEVWSRDMKKVFYQSTAMFKGCIIIIIIGSRDSAVDMATGYELYSRGVGFPAPVRSRIFPSPRCTDRFWGSPNLFNGYRGIFPSEWPEREADHSLPTSAEVNNTVPYLLNARTVEPQKQPFLSNIRMQQWNNGVLQPASRQRLSKHTSAQAQWRHIPKVLSYHVTSVFCVVCATQQ